MRTVRTRQAQQALAIAMTCAAIGSAAFFSPRAGMQTNRVSVALVDRDSGKVIPGVIRIRQADGRTVLPENLISRGWGLDANAPISEWLVLPGETIVELPREKLVVEAISGIESERTVIEVNVANEPPEVRIPLNRFADLRAADWFAANTHLHLRNFTREESDRYLREIPRADRLDALFISYLERAEDDRSYITNQYPPGRLADLETGQLVVASGEEHRHNFDPQGEGYGHVMLLGIKELVRPVSIGFGISKKHPDWPPIRWGIDRAHEQGGTAIWCHNNWGYEDVANWIAGRLDAQNIFDGGSHDGYEQSFYHYLNAGLRVPFSTGTDWFMYDFARCYARVTDELTPESWLAALHRGRTFITNGPIVDLQVNGAGPGETIDLAAPTELKIEAAAQGRLDFGRLELLSNGQVVNSADGRPRDGHFDAKLSVKLNVSEPCWLAARISGTQKNEYGATLFGHTSPVYVTRQGRPVQIESDVRFLLGQATAARSAIFTQGHFDDDSQRDAVLQLYDRAISELETRLGKLAR